MIHTTNSPARLLNPYQAVEERPSQHKAGEAAKQAARPEIQRAVKESGRVEEGFLFAERGRCYLEDVEEEGGDDGEDEVEEEASIRFEAEDASGYTEQGGREAVKVGERLYQND